MFGRRPPPPVNWDELYFYEKVQHVTDQSIDFLLSKCRWWLPSVTAGVLLSFFLMGGPDALLQVSTIGSVVIQPAVSPVLFQTPKGVPDMPPEEEDDDE